MARHDEGKVTPLSFSGRRDQNDLRIFVTDWYSHGRMTYPREEESVSVNRDLLAIDASSTIEDRTIDIIKIGRRPGEPRRIEIVFYRLGDDIYLSGIPGRDQRSTSTSAKSSAWL